MRPLLLLFAAGCIAGMGYSTRDKVTEATREYNSGVRWGRYEQAAEHLPKDRRHRFFERHKALEDELEIADCEVVNLDIDTKKQEATARVDYVWSLKRVGLVEKTSTDQTWRKIDGEWRLSSEVRVKGSPLTLFDEPPAH
jgi:hypothetical protein